MIIFVDIETSGLSFEADEIWEIFAVKVCKDFYPREELHILIKPDYGIDAYSNHIKGMHLANGLFADACNKGIDRDEAEQLLFDFFQSDKLDDKVILGGSSVHFDRRFLESQFPCLSEKLHYRMLDVRALNLIYPEIELTLPYPKDEHRAKPDCINACYTARWYNRLLRRCATQGNT